MAEPPRPPGPLSVIGIVIVITTVFIDQVSKAIAEASLPLGMPIDVLPTLSLYRVHNPGIAFSFLAEFSGLGLTLGTLAITLVVIVVWWRSSEGGRWASAGFALIIGGAVGNLIDRFRYGYVVDFLLLHIGDWTLFVFNLADVALTFGPLILFIVYLRPRKAGAGGSAD